MPIIIRPFAKVWFAIPIAVLLAASCVIAYVWREEDRPKLLEIYILNLKSAPAIFIRTPNDERILIDGGSNAEVIRQITRILPFYSRNIGTVIATKPFGKNVTGLIDVIERYAVRQIYVPAVTLASLGLPSSTDRIYSSFIDAALEKGMPIGEVSIGDDIILDGLGPEQDSVRAKILFPASSTAFAYSKTSAPELMMSIGYGSNAVILLGNATPKIQKFIAAQGTTAADVLIAWNNALPDSLFAGLIDQIRPDYLIYSKSLTVATKTSTNKKEKADPLAYLASENRFNIKEFEYVKITLDGTHVSINVSP